MRPAVLLPLFVQVALTFVLLFWFGRACRRRRCARRVRSRDIALRERSLADRAQQIANAFDNQFELPVLFYVVAVLALITRKADLIFVVLSWMFVASASSRLRPHGPKRACAWRRVFHGIGVAVLVVMWVVFALRILAGP